jgi:hypothetical protein
VRAHGPALAALAAPTAVALALGSCGGVISPDLFVIERSAAGPQGPLTVLVNEEGLVRCNHGAPQRLSDAQLIEARTIQEELQRPSSRRLSVPPRPGSVYGYRVRDANGSVSFADNSSGLPKVLEHVQLFAQTVAAQVCRLPAVR